MTENDYYKSLLEACKKSEIEDLAYSLWVIKNYYIYKSMRDGKTETRVYFYFSFHSIEEKHAKHIVKNFVDKGFECKIKGFWIFKHMHISWKHLAMSNKLTSKA